METNISLNEEQAYQNTTALPPLVLTITITSCSLSAFGSLVQIFTYFLWKDLRLLPRQLLVYISLADLLAAISLGYGAVEDFQSSSVACILQAFVSTFATTCSLFWMVALLVYILVTVVTVNPDRSQRLVKYFHPICWGLPAVLQITALLYRGLGTTRNTLTTGWCWVKVESSAELRLFWILFTQKLWEFAGYIILIVLCIVIKLQVAKRCNARDASIPRGTAEAMRKINKKVVLVPVLVILLRIWGTVRLALALQNSHYTRNTTLLALQGIGDTGQGFANFIVFCVFTARTREVISAETSDILNNIYSRLEAIQCCSKDTSSSYDETKPLLYNRRPGGEPQVHFHCPACGSGSQSTSVKSGQITETLPASNVLR